MAGPSIGLDLDIEYARVAALAADLTAADGERDRELGVRLRDCVVRPLAALLGPPTRTEPADPTEPAEPAGLTYPAEPAEPGEPEHPAEPADPAEPGGRVDPAEIGRLAARLGTVAATAGEAPVEVVFAAAALRDLAAELASPVPDADRPAASQGAVLRVVPGGPYVLRGAGDLYDPLGCRLPARPLRTLCRCGGSAAAPACDGACVRDGFSDAKDPKRVPDRRDSYVGHQVTVLDNRGICQHAGYCSDRLATVFRAGAEPFVAPSGGRLDEIVRAVRDCPSGALSYAIDGVEARQQVDHGGTRPAAVHITANGPYRISGGVGLVDADGRDVPRAAGASREHYALCRCGHSQNKPFCSGMHWHIGFTDPEPEPGRVPTIFEWAHGLGGLERMTRIFYEKYVPADPILAPLFSTMAADHARRVAEWLAEVFCGPALYSERHGGYGRMLGQHLGKHLTEEQRTRWVDLLMRSAREAGLPNDAEFRSAFGSYIEWGSRLAVENSQTTSRPPERMPMPHWDWNTAAGPPGSRISALRPPEPEVPKSPVRLPGPDAPVGFADHVRPLFRDRDRNSMRFAFDLWSYDDVRAHGAAILARLTDGSMPCDGAWPPERLAVLRRWLDTGTAP